MGTFDSSWVLILGLAVFVAWLGWTLLRSRRETGKPEEPVPPVAKETAAEDVAAVESPAALPPVETAAPPAPTAPPAQAPTSPPPPPPAPAPVSPHAALPSRLMPSAEPDPAPRQMEAIPVTRGRPPAPRVERVLAVERASGSSEGQLSGGPVPLQLAQSVALLMAADMAGAAGIGSVPEWVVRLPAVAAMPIAHGDLGALRALASANESSSSPMRPGLDSVAAGELAGAVLAAEASERHLRPLGDEVQDLKAAFAAIAAKALGAHEARLKPLVQELTRYTRDARDSYAALIGKAAFRERVAEAASRALQCWQAAAGLDAATREPLDALVATSRFGEVQVEKARSLLHEHRQAQRVQAVAARALAAASILRLVMGAPVDDSREPLDAASRVLQASIERDGMLQQRLRAAEAGARGDPYVGRGEFEANRAALRKLLEGLGSDLAAAHARLGAASAAFAEGFPGERSGWLCSVRAAGTGGLELRVRTLEPV